MAQINNKNLLKGMIDTANIQISRDSFPNQLADKIVPVMECNTKLLRRSNIAKGAGAINSTSATIYTTPADKDFYLISVALSMIKDVTSTSTQSLINCTIDGVSQNILSIIGLTATIQSGQISNSYPIPLKIDRNTIISVTNSTNNANISARGHIVGFVDEDLMT